MKPWSNILKIIILIIGVVFLSFDVLLYNSFEKQKNEISTMHDQQKADSEVSGNKFKYQQEQIEGLSKDLEEAQQQIKDQRDDSKSVQTSLVDIKAEADAIKQDMKAWQKDYVTVLAGLEKKMDDSQDGIKSVKESVDSLKADVEKIAPAPDNSLPDTPPAPEKKNENQS